MDSLSPFNMVFGRRPRLSAQDICFPVKAAPLPLPQDKAAREYMEDVNSRLQALRFQAREASIESKEVMRQRHDDKRGPSLKTRPNRDVAVGDVIAVCKPTPTL